MHTRGSHESSPLLFDPEIERTLRRNRVLVRENRILGSPTSPITPRNIMQETQIPPTTGQTTSSFLPTSTQPSPNTTMPNTITNPTLPHDSTPTHTTQPIYTQVEPNLTFSPASTIPPFSHFFPTTGQSSSTYPLPQGSTVIHTTSTYRPPTQSGFQYSSFPIGQSSGFQRDRYDDGYEEEYSGIMKKVIIMEVMEDTWDLKQERVK